MPVLNTYAKVQMLVTDLMPEILFGDASAGRVSVAKYPEYQQIFILRSTP